MGIRKHALEYLAGGRRVSCICLCPAYFQQGTEAFSFPAGGFEGLGRAAQADRLVGRRRTDPVDSGKVQADLGNPQGVTGLLGKIKGACEGNDCRRVVPVIEFIPSEAVVGLCLPLRGTVG